MLVGAPSPVNTLAAPSPGRAGTARDGGKCVRFRPLDDEARPSWCQADAPSARARPATRGLDDAANAAGGARGKRPGRARAPAAIHIEVERRSGQDGRDRPPADAKRSGRAAGNAYGTQRTTPRHNCEEFRSEKELDDSEGQGRIRDDDPDRHLQHVLLRRETVLPRVRGIAYRTGDRFRLVAPDTGRFEVFRCAQGVERAIHEITIAQAPAPDRGGCHDAANAARSMDVED